MQADERRLQQESAAVQECKHQTLVLERRASRQDYLTGWYVCTACGDRLLPR